jgi:hypothetical protein
MGREDIVVGGDEDEAKCSSTSVSRSSLGIGDCLNRHRF